MATLNDVEIRARLAELVNIVDSVACQRETLLQQVNPASLDLTLAPMVRIPRSNDIPLMYGDCEQYKVLPDLAKKFPVSRRYTTKVLPSDGWLTLDPGKAVLAVTREWITMPQDLCGQVMLKSSMARCHINHMLAGFVDPGFSGALTLELSNQGPYPVLIPIGVRIAQIRFDQLTGPAGKGYDQTGHYNGDYAPGLVQL